MERYIDPGKENAWRLGRWSELGDVNGRPNLQEVGDDVGEEDAERVNIAILLEEVIEILKVSKRLWYTQQRSVLPKT
jgi:hypothetical protein